jgi:hypothetical protein
MCANSSGVGQWYCWQCCGHFVRVALVPVPAIELLDTCPTCALLLLLLLLLPLQIMTLTACLQTQ